MSKINQSTNITYKDYDSLINDSNIKLNYSELKLYLIAGLTKHNEFKVIDDILCSDNKIIMTKNLFVIL